MKHIYIWKYISPIFAVFLFALVGFQAEGLAQQSTSDSINNGGTSSGEWVANENQSYHADQFTGRFTYSIPIEVPPDRQEFQPKLVLGYNSAMKNGWCGVGWSLDADYIQRNTKWGVPVLAGMSNFFNAYDDSKGFISYSGGMANNLVLISPTNQNPEVFRNRDDKSFSIYEYYTNNYWEVIEKSGNIYFFGENATNQMENTKTNWQQGAGASTFRWALDRQIDPNGNEIFYNYITDGNRLYLTNILYNANTNGLMANCEVDFVLTNRTDTNTDFTSNFRVTSVKLLSNIIIKSAGQNVRDYALSYVASPSTLRSLLTSVTEYGADAATAYPPITFNYQVQLLGFEPDNNWSGLYSQGETNQQDWSSIEMSDSDGNTELQLVDIDGDGLPDRVMVPVSAPYTNGYIVERNTGSGFVAKTNYIWGPLDLGGSTTHSNNTINNGALALIDLNGDGRPDRIYAPGTSTNFYAQINSGFQSPSDGFSVGTNFGGALVSAAPLRGYTGGINHDPYYAVSAYNFNIIDINGDGIPDFIENNFTTNYVTSLGTSSNFIGAINFPPFDYAEKRFGNSAVFLGLPLHPPNGTSWANVYQMYTTDINGDGLPDLVFAYTNTDIASNDYVGNSNTQIVYTKFLVQFNNGTGYEPPEPWGPLYIPTNQTAWECPIAQYEYLPSSWVSTESSLVDMNGDGLPDRVMEVVESSLPHTNWLVQLNTGSGFGPVLNWGPIESSPTDTNSAMCGITAQFKAVDGDSDTFADLIDINGDGLPDRVMLARSAPYTNYVVELNQGPFPDLLSSVSNGIGGSVQINYVASTTLDNRNTNWVSDPWSEGTKSLLPFNVWVVSQIVASDGMGDNGTNSYVFKGGYYDSAEREFRGFSQCTATDPLGTKTITYFHQSGGRDNSSLGEFMDLNSESKKGIPFRTDIIGNDGKTNKITLNEVNEVVLNSNGWYFPYIAQTIVMNYEGLSSYRAIAAQFNYDTNTENLTNEVDYGEVTNIVFNGQTFTDIGNDSVYKWMKYTNIGNILNRPSDIKITLDSAEANRLQEMLSSYDANGNLKISQSWLNTASAFITTVSNNYDQYGNLTQTTDAAGITTTTTYDSTFEQFPVSSTTGTFTSSFTYDNRSGLMLTDTDAKGLVSSNVYDVFFRPTTSYISTNSYGPPVLWQSFTTYSLGGISAGISHNYVFSQVNNAVDEVNGFQTYTYSDGLGRTIETRSESETAGQDRVANTVYDLRGNPDFATLPYFSSGTTFTAPSGTYLGALTAYDSIGRACQTTPAVKGTFTSGLLTGVSATSGDTGSPVGPATTAFVDGSNPWATVVTDANGKVRKSYRDAYGRTIQTLDLASSGNVATTYGYDLLGDLTNVTDNAANSTAMGYDSLGRKISMIDPDMGTWSYAYDNDNRMTQQTDAKNNVIKFFYSDQLGRLTSKQIYNGSGAQAGTITYTYDTSDDPTYTVYPGQLYKVTDLQGYERFSYDVRGRVLKDARLLGANAIEYLTQATYDDADRIQQLTYPGDAATIQYTYDVAGHLSQVASTAGTGTNETFYMPRSFNAMGQLTGYTNGNGVTTAYAYFANSQRLQNLATVLGATNYQNLSYTYDDVSDVSSINDGVYTGSASASVSSITYDDLYRVTSLNSTARGVKTYGYNSIGNILTNQDFGTGLYQYGAKPHAVTSANGVTYAYDACGNMTNRGNQTLVFDAQNQLVQVVTTNDSVAYGYDDSGERLWRAGTNGYTIWIGGIYEINNGKVLCHVMAGGQLIATFEPQCNAGLARVFGEKNWYVASGRISAVLGWPFQEGRGRWTILGGTWAGIMGLCLVGGRGVRLKRHEIRKAFGWTTLWRQAVTVLMITAFLTGSIGDVDAAPVYSPVFYFYHPDALGSSNILTDRSGNLVQHYEYGTFGQTSYQNNSSAFPVSNRYTGQIADDETGLYYYGGRYYDPQLGRFIQPDPTIPDPTDSQSFNRYSYCRNNPLNETDPSGFDDMDQMGEGDDDYSGFDSSGINDFLNSSSSFSNAGPLGELGSNYVVGAVGEPPYFFESNSGNTTIDPTTNELDYHSAGFGESSDESQTGSASNFNIAHFWDPPTADQSVQSTVATPTAVNSDGWLAIASDAASLLSVFPVVGDVAGIAQAGIDIFQGNYGQAAWDGGTALAATFGLGIVIKAAEKYGKYTIGAYNALKNGAEAGLEAHHVGQKALMKKLVAGYDPQIAPSILVPKAGHTLGEKVLSRNLNVNNARSLIARDIKELRRVYPDIPNSKLQKLIEVNKQMYPEMSK